MSYADIKAKKKTVSALISDGMRQLHTSDVENKILTVTDMDAIMARNGRCGVMLFKEFPGCFYFAGKVLTEMCDEFLADEEAISELKSGKVQICIKKARSASSGNEYITFDYVTDEE